MGRNQEECNTAKWGKKRQLTSGCHLSFIGFPFFGPNFIFVLKVSSKTTHFTKKPISLTWSCFRENIKCYWIPNKDVKTGETITYL